MTLNRPVASAVKGRQITAGAMALPASQESRSVTECDTASSFSIVSVGVLQNNRRGIISVCSYWLLQFSQECFIRMCTFVLSAFKLSVET